MITKYAALIIAAMLAFPHAAESQSRIPFHPYRKLGNLYCDLRTIYSWIDTERTDPRQQPQPMANWKIFRKKSEYGIFSWYEVNQVTDDGVLIQEVRRFDGGKDYKEMFFLKNFPNYKTLVDDQVIEFIAAEIPNYRYTSTSGASRSVRCFDYGIPYDPEQLKREKESPNATNPTPKHKTPVPPNKINII